MERLGLSRTALTRVLAGLFDDRLLEEEEELYSVVRAAGRPARRLSARRPPRVTLTVQVTTSELVVASVNEIGMILQEERHEIALDDGVSEVARVIQAQRSRPSAEEDLRPSRMVVVVPTMVSADGARVDPDGAGSLMPSWIHPDVGARLGRVVGLPTLLQNDGRLAALAEARIGAARGMRNVLYIAPGANGIAAGLVLDGRLHTGAGSAGEMSHVVTRIDGCPCPCGQRGCLAAEVRETVRRLRRSSGIGEHDRDAMGVPTDAPGAAEALAQITTMIARVIGGTVNLLHPEAVVIADRLTNDSELGLRPRLAAAVPLYAHPAMIPAVSLRASSLGVSAALSGAGIVDGVERHALTTGLPG